jgi:hypothetical protein
MAIKKLPCSFGDLLKTLRDVRYDFHHSGPTVPKPKKVFSRSSGNQLLRHLGDMPLPASSLDGPKFSHFAGDIRRGPLIFALFFEVFPI